ncbi:hypothetical protein DM860_011020 [Cuscuta australis]|uniref:Hydrogen peroxide induced protein 1 n=1 Tax=Cuscuta australis TaxID=267555 RepID=A0A328E496_9ASTE|nr:hypothetical protein DM860_011020 [Cuscuta australis]
MAANLQKSSGIAGGLGKLFGRKIVTRANSPSSSAPLFSRGVHASAYDKNPEEHAPHSPVPDEIIQQVQSDKYWAPHPHTGVFGPDTANHLQAASTATLPGSALDQKAFFRPLEGLEKPDPPSL